VTFLNSGFLIDIFIEFDESSFPFHLVVCASLLADLSVMFFVLF
jgi:hypothetical protein